MISRPVVLVTGAGGVFGDATVRNLQHSSLRTYVIGADIVWHASGVLSANKSIVLPRVDDPAYIDQLVNAVRTNRVDVVFVSSGTEIRELAPRRDELERESQAIFILPSADLYQMASDKLKTVNFLASHGFDYPATITTKGSDEVGAFTEQVGFPLIAKPRFGSGSRGLALCSSIEDVNRIVALEEEYVLQQAIGDEDHEYTVGVIATEEQNVLASITLRRWLRGGQTEAAEVVDIPSISTYAESLGAKLRPRGYVNIQLRMLKERPIAFEVNARISSSTGFRALAGVNEPELILRKYLLKENPPRPNAEPIVMVRGWSERLVDRANWKDVAPN